MRRVHRCSVRSYTAESDRFSALASVHAVNVRASLLGLKYHGLATSRSSESVPVTEHFRKVAQLTLDFTVDREPIAAKDMPKLCASIVEARSPCRTASARRTAHDQGPTLHRQMPGKLLLGERHSEAAA